MTKDEAIRELHDIHHTYYETGGSSNIAIASVLRKAIAIVEKIDHPAATPTGLTKAEEFAKAALTGMCANPRSDDQTFSDVADEAKKQGESLAERFEEQSE